MRKFLTGALGWRAVFSGFAKICALVLPSLVLLSCSPPESAPHLYFIPVVSTSGGPSEFQWVELAGIESLSPLRVEGFEFLDGPFLAEPDRLAGHDVHIQVTRQAGGRAVPTDVHSAAALGLYHHLKTLKEEYESLSGIPMGRITVGLRANVRWSNSWDALHNRAFFHRASQSLIFTEFSSEGLVPLSLNPGVVAHEFFHLIFSKHLDLRAFAEINRALLDNPFSATVWDGLNEGLADYWGYLYTSDPRFVLPSAPEQTARSLDLPVIALPSVDQLNRWLRGGDPRLSFSLVYSRFMPAYARFFKVSNDILSTSLDAGLNPRVRVLELLNALKEALFFEKKELTPDLVIRLYGDIANQPISSLCSLLRTVSGMSAAESEVQFRACQRGLEP